MNKRSKTTAPQSIELSLRTRSANIERMRRERFDLAVIGGGITGAGIALDAASRGFSVAMVEKRDFASGTSSRSTKLIHGGLRYLQQFQFGLVRDALRERATLRRLAPHLSEPLAFLIPIYDSGKRSPLGKNRLKLKLGLWLYDRLAGRKNIARHRWVSSEEALRAAPSLEPRGLRGGFIYYDCLTEDSRLVMEVVKAASAYGASVANYAAALGLVRNNGRISGIKIMDSIFGHEFEMRARAVVNATGVWSDEIMAFDQTNAAKKVRPSKGIHIVVPSEKLGNQVAVLIPSVGEKRFLFVIPWRGRMVIGTTDADYSGDIDEPVAEPEEIERVVASAAHYFPGAVITADDVISTFAGLRPLVRASGGSTSALSREEEIIESESGLISIIGGKLTTYRRMAERVVDLVAGRLKAESRGGSQPARSFTQEIKLAGGAFDQSATGLEAARAAVEFGVPREMAEHMIRVYGGNYRVILETSRESENLKSILVDGLPHIEAEVVYAARFEMAMTVEDFLARRSRIALLAPDHGHSCAARVAHLMGNEHGRSNTELLNALTQSLA